MILRISTSESPKKVIRDIIEEARESIKKEKKISATPARLEKTIAIKLVTENKGSDDGNEQKLSAMKSMDAMEGKHKKLSPIKLKISSPSNKKYTFPDLSDSDSLKEAIRRSRCKYLGNYKMLISS